MFRRRALVREFRSGLGCAPRCLAGLLAGLAMASSVSATSVADPVWDRPAFSVEPAELLAAAQAVPADERDGVLVLLREARYEIDEQKRVDYRYRLIYRVLSPQTVRGWSRVSSSWSPWFQQRPEIRARVITPEGEVHELDPSNIGEYSDAERGPDLYGDRMEISGPLPAVTVGAVVEEEHRVRDSAPFFAAGAVYSFSFGGGRPTHRARLILDVPASLPLRYRTYLLPDVDPHREERDGRLRLVFQHGPLASLDEAEALLPSDVPRRPRVRFSTGESWSAVARSYAELVEQRLDQDELAKQAKKARRGATEREEVVARLLRFVHDEVRYTGVEFGDQAIVPTTPRETLRRGFGDCKDKSTLLVGLLRESGIEARVALLDAGSDFDVDPELPGLGWFDHAIVYVPGDPALWIDPTDSHVRVGELPPADQGRLALIADAATRELTRTPAAGPADNRVEETREIFLAPSGGARLVETTHWRGAFDRRVRSVYADASVEDRREKLEDYVRRAYGGGRLERFEFSDFRDLRKPLELVLEADGIEKAWTDPARAAVVVPLGALLADLPEEVKPEADESAEAAARPSRKPRRDDLVLPVPFVKQWRYVVHPAPGFAPLELPEGALRALGPATLTSEYAAAEDGSVTAVFRLDSGKARYTPEEVEATRRDLAVLYKEKQPQLLFDQVGEAHLEAGRIREALDEFRGLVERFPEQALHRSQVARALLAAGLGEVAREEARTATRLEPESAEAHVTSGVVLAHDLLGRKFRQGMDWAGAESALRRAKQLDPQNFQARGELAILLEHDDDGTRYVDRARLERAVEEYEQIRSELSNEALTTNLLVDLLHLERFGRLQEVVREVGRGNRQHEMLRLAALAAESGADAAIREASRVSSGPDDYRALLDGAGEWMMRVRRYPLSADLIAAAAKGKPDAVSRLTLAEALRRTQRHDRLDTSLATPQGLVRRLFVEMFTSDDPGRAVLELFDPSLLERLPNEDPEELTGYFAYQRWLAGQEGVSLESVLDIMLSLARMSVEGDDELGRRVRIRFVGLPVPEMPELGVYAVPRGGEYRIGTLSDAVSTAGPLILAWVAEGKLDRAARWLDWIHEETDAAVGQDPLSGHPLRRLWRRGDDADAARMRLAAAALMGDAALAEEGLAILDTAAEGASEGELALGIEAARSVLARVLERYDVQAEAAARLVAALPRSTLAFSALAEALIRLERWDDLEAALARRLERDAGDLVARQMRVAALFQRERHAEAMRQMRELIDEGKATASEFNNLAWLEIVEGQLSDDTLSHAQHAAAMDEYLNPASLHTVATVYAELGRPAEARDVLLSVLDSRESPELESADWYVLGRIAEDYGVREAAESAYRKVEPPEESEPMASSTYRIAQRRLTALAQEAKR